MCCGSTPGVPNRDFQSPNGLAMVTVTVLSLSEPSTGCLWSSPTVLSSDAQPPFAGSALFWICQVNSKSLAVIGWPSDQTAFGLILYVITCLPLVVCVVGSPTTRSLSGLTVKSG